MVAPCPILACGILPMCVPPKFFLFLFAILIGNQWFNIIANSSNVIISDMDLIAKV